MKTILQIYREKMKSFPPDLRGRWRDGDQSKKRRFTKRYVMAQWIEEEKQLDQLNGPANKVSYHENIAHRRDHRIHQKGSQSKDAVAD